MTAPARATSRGNQRFYSWRGQRYWSVTTITKGGLPTSYGLRQWDRSSVALGAVQEHDVIGTMLANCDTPNECRKVKSHKELCEACDRVLRWLMDIPFSKRDKAGDIGTYVHNATEAYVLGKPFPKWPVTVVSRMKAFEQFLADFAPEYEATESSVYNRKQRYAGTLDAIVTIGGRKLLIDTKTAAKGVYPEVALQLAAYRYAEFIGLPDGSEEPMREVDGCAALSLPGEGYDLVDVDAGPEEFKFFLHARESFRWQEDASKSVLRGPLRHDAPEGVQAFGQLLIDGAPVEKEEVA